MKTTKKHKIIIFNLLFVFLFSLFFISFVQAQQKTASLFLAPSSGSYQVGSTFTLTVSARSEQQAMNAAEASLRFDPSIIRVRSVSKANSIFAFWPIEPTFSNAAGTVNFTGGSPTPFRGSSGRIIVITFEAVKEGTALINFSQGKILAADGAGTDITSGLVGGNYTITKRTTPLPETPMPSVQTLVAPRISSPTHPDPEKWYNNNSPEFNWELPEGVTGIRLLISESSVVQPNQIYDSSTTSYQTKDIDDGIWHFSIQLRNQHGWGSVGRFRFQIDTVPPESFKAEIDNEGDSTNPVPIFRFEAFDELSGIDYYEIILNNNLYATVRPEEVEEGFYRPRALPPDDYYLSVRAVDKAGNFTLSDQDLTITPPFETLASLYFLISPIFLELRDIPSQILVKDPLIIEGKTLPEIKVKVYIQQQGEEELIIKEIRSDEQGHFQFKEFLSKGKYFIWVEAEDERGALSESMEKHVLEVKSDRLSFFLLILLIILIIIGIFVIWFLWKRMFEDKEKNKEQVVKQKIETKQKAYSVLKEQIEKQIEYLEEKVDLSRSETRLLDELKKALLESEKAREEEKIFEAGQNKK